MKALIAHPPERKSHFVRACFLKAHAGIQNRSVDDFLLSTAVVERALIERAAINPANTTTAGNAAELVQTAFPGFLASLAPYSAAARIISGAVPSSLGPDGSAKYPTRTTLPTAPQWVAESGAIPINIANFGLIDVGPKRKIASILPWTRELTKRSDAEAIFEQMLREDVAAGLDAAMLSTAAGSGSAYAGLLNGVSALSGYGGGDQVAIEEDLIALGTAITANGGSGQVLFIMAPERAIRLKVRAPLLTSSMDIATSAAVPAGRVIAVDPASIISAVDSMPDLEFTEQATVHMSDTPLPISSGGVADPVRSLWQTASMALRVIMDLAWAKRRTNAVAYLEAATW
ncbi:hypothetical protein [Ferirhizobium litorale]|uniref:Phage major capsid protein n=1 Tax=Ferirhizobium litorale TaxID=2927786 RepID=A0AAE3U1K9_9HYPH|nr:hypothetical protein [Fererhizobium litorale]MDI7921747.1 hypothetical protein [Fererhizobium litorale]